MLPGLSYGEALLAPTALYAPVTEALWRAGIVPHYCANITGHGWRKLLRHPARSATASSACPTCRRCCVSSNAMRRSTIGEAYSTFNMGAGFALFVAADDAARAVQIAQAMGFGALLAGAVHDGSKQLTIEPLSLRFDADDLQLR